MVGTMASRRDSGNMCVCQVCDDVRSRLNKIFTVLDTYGWLLDTYIVDFFEDDVWSKLPGDWRKVLGHTSPEELGEWMLGNTSSGRLWPLSLLAFRETIKVLGINRDYPTEELLQCNGSEQSNCNKELKNLSQTTKRKLVDPKYEKLFTKSVKKKKRHEIENIAKTTSELATLAKCECIIDIGAGMGHLARTLAYNYGLCVVCLEQDESLSDQARKCDENLLALLKKKMPDILARNPHHVSTKVSDSDIQGEELAKKLINDIEEHFGQDQSKGGFGLIGLHSCGNLAATLLKFHATQKESRFICIVGCCYMKITPGYEPLENKFEAGTNPSTMCHTFLQFSNIPLRLAMALFYAHQRRSKKRTMETASFGYPLSKHVSMANNHRLSYAALEVACHAIENYSDKLRTGDYQDLLVHAYRATLEVVLIRKNGKRMRRSHLKNVKLKRNMSFQRYCLNATEVLKPENQPDPTDLNTDEVSNCLKRWREVVAFGSLRFMLAPLVETAVLLDRFLYLSERNFAPSLRPIFDPRVSPRNIVLTAWK